MLKKIIPITVAAVAMLLPVAPAAAWDEVCLHLRGSARTWFIGQLNIVHGFDAARGNPSSYPPPRPRLTIDLREKRVFMPWLNGGGEADPNPAETRLRSGNISANRTACESIAHLRPGEPFLVFLNTYRENKVLCETHESNPNDWYLQTNRPYRKIFFNAWGAEWSPKCHFNHESN